MRAFLTAVCAATMLAALPHDAAAESSRSTRSRLDAILAGDHRLEAHVARDRYRHPKQTLSFFGIEPDMTVVELSPGRGYYTEIMAPLLAERGHFIAATYSANAGARSRKRLAGYLEKLAAHPDHYDRAVVVPLGYPTDLTLAPPGSADLVLTFRNVHNWMWANADHAVFAAAYAALKPGGVFGVVEHRWPEDLPGNEDGRNGYVRRSHVVAVAEAVGFELAGESDVNANPKDDHQHPEGVWTLPPALRLGDRDRETYLAIGESDRFTLKFVKPATPSK